MPSEPLWQRALRNRKHWDNHTIATDAFELARRLKKEAELTECIRKDELRERERLSRQQLQAERMKRKNSPPIVPLPNTSAEPCPRCGEPQHIKQGLTVPMHIGASCTLQGVTRVTRVTRIPAKRVDLTRCGTESCKRLSVSVDGFCALCASRARAAGVVDK